MICYLKKNKKLFQIILVLSCFSLLSCDQEEKQKPKRKKQKSQINKIEEDQLTVHESEVILKVITLFKDRNIEKISNNIAYPLYREYPIPKINNKKEFVKRFNEVFDKSFVDKIANSKLEDWSEVGWRGIMFDNGLLWMANSDGIITSINYQSNFEKKLKIDLIDKEKSTLYFSIKNFESPFYKMETKKYLIRIDQLKNSKYRYSSWNIGKKENSKPELILENGEIEYQGSGGNHVISFSKGDHIYKIYRNILGSEDTPDINLEVEKNGRLILAEDGKLIRK